MGNNFKIMGIYKITNKMNGKFYIGSSNNINRRWESHINDLKADRHCNQYLQRAWNKYGENNFLFTVIEIVDKEELLLEVEQMWIDNTKCYLKDIGYNISDNATAPDVNLSKSFTKIARIDFQKMILNDELSINEKSILFSLMPFVSNNENAIKMNGKYATQEQLEFITGYKRTALYKGLKILKEKNLLKTVKRGSFNINYLNPYYIRYNDKIDKNIYEIFDTLE